MTDAFAVLLLREMRLSARAPVADDDEEGGAEVCPGAPDPDRLYERHTVGPHPWRGRKA